MLCELPSTRHKNLETSSGKALPFKLVIYLVDAIGQVFNFTDEKLAIIKKEGFHLIIEKRHIFIE